MSSSEHPVSQAPAEAFDPARMNAQTARLMASDMASLAGAMFRLLQPQAAVQPEPERAAAAAAAPTTSSPIPDIAVPQLDLQPSAPSAAPSDPGPATAVPAIAVPSLAVPGTVPPADDTTLADFDLDPEAEADHEHEEYDVPELAEQPASSGDEEPDLASPRSQALLNEIAFLDD